MSYDLSLVNRQGEDVVLKENHHHKGGTYALGGTAYAEFNITCNYSKILRRVLKRPEGVSLRGGKNDEAEGIRAIYGLTPKQAIPALESAVDALGPVEPCDDYWEATEGNVKKALLAVLHLSRLCAFQHPDSHWDGD